MISVILNSSHHARTRGQLKSALKQSYSTTASDSHAQSLAASAAAAIATAAATAAGPIPFSLSPMTPATADKAAVMDARAHALQRHSSTRRPRDQFEEDEDGDDECAEEELLPESLPFTAAKAGLKGTPAYQRNLNDRSQKNIFKEAKQSGTMPKTNLDIMSPFVCLSTAKLVVLLQHQRPPDCRCVSREGSDLLIIQQAHNGASTRFSVECVNCRKSYIYSTGDQWLGIPPAQINREYVRRTAKRSKNETVADTEESSEEDNSDDNDGIRIL